ncbi:MAG: methyltransferase [Promethearchaeota archaeon]
MIRISFLPDPIIDFDFENIYAPSDDTYLLIDYFKSKINQMYFDGIKLSEIKNVLDLGTGTGIIAIFLQLIKLNNINFNPKIYASDILENAIECAKLNEKRNNIDNQIEFLCSDLFSSFPECLKHSFNIIVFNPPYLPSSDFIKKNLNKMKIDYSWNGGIKGYEILIEFLSSAKDFLDLKIKHYIYVITSSRTNLLELNKIIENYGYRNEVVQKKHFFFEDIILNRLQYNIT